MGKQHAEIEVVCEYNRLILPRPLHDFRIGRVGIADRGPVQSLESSQPEHRNPLRRKIHVDDDFHATGSGTSISSTRHAA